MNKKSKPSITRTILNAVRNTAVRNVDMASMMGTFEAEVPEKLLRGWTKREKMTSGSGQDVVAIIGMAIISLLILFLF